MAAAPRFKVFDGNGTYQGATKELEAAAALVAFYGDNASIRIGHATKDIVWLNGIEQDGEAAESYDYVAEIASKRITEKLGFLGTSARR